jgi:uncharacterized protein (DUF1697 family)
MPTHVALLRGINLGPHKRVSMPALRSVVAALGHSDVATYVQSGNVVFTPADPDAAPAADLAADVEKAIAAELDVTCRVVVLPAADLARVVADNPYPDEPDPKRVHTFFLLGEPDDAMREYVAAAVRRSKERGSRDEARLVGRALYLHTPDGFGTSKLAAELSRPRGPAQGTARNWATVTRLLALCEG